jgi:hypothetical protein
MIIQAMRYRFATSIALLASAVGCQPKQVAPSPTPSSQPTTIPYISNDDSEAIAKMAYNDQDYDGARPLLQSLADRLKADPNQAKKLSLIKEEIRVCDKNHIESASKTRTPFRPVKPGETLETAIPQLGNFDFDAEKGSPIPNDVKALSGCNIRITGFMIPMDEPDHISKFALMPSAYHHGEAKVQHTIIVNCPKAAAVTYCPDEITVEGKLTVEVQQDDGYIVSIFQIQSASVKPLAK